ncbi:hypothetical protein [Allorhizocola rhizosphaerae]|uniref:hypothetical protein n=1 Tax=Allorhizocola rhizosphaerae TaxID=1872709 RepID=UPI000E3D52F4|nr:hypothetical protein [Allorhizocola rhizosphaerae]
MISTAATTLDRAPKITAAAVDGLRTRTFEWQVPLFEDKPPLAVAGAKLDKRPGGNAHLRIESVVTMGLDGQPHRGTACRITDVVATFRLGNADLVHMPVHSIEFVSVGTEKPVVNVHIGEIEFLGVLGFVNRLASLIGGDGFGGARALSGPNAANPANAVVPNGPALDVTTSGVRASYGLAIPSVAVGMFSLENITLGVMATLSLTYYGGKVRGEAELCFYVSTFFFSKTVKRTFSRTFAGSNGDPTFAELMAPQGFPGARPWDTYCKAFV